MQTNTNSNTKDLACTSLTLSLCFISLSLFVVDILPDTKATCWGPFFSMSNHEWTNMYPYHELHALTKLTNIIFQIHPKSMVVCLSRDGTISYHECSNMWMAIVTKLRAYYLAFWSIRQHVLLSFQYNHLIWLFPFRCVCTCFRFIVTSIANDIESLNLSKYLDHALSVGFSGILPSCRNYFSM